MQVHLGDNRRFAQPFFPSELDQPHAFTEVIGIKPQTLPPIGLLTPSLGNNQIVMKEALSAETGVRTPRRAREDPQSSSHAAWFSLACPLEFPFNDASSAEKDEASYSTGDALGYLRFKQG